MTSIQIAAIVYFTVIAIGAWIFFAIIFLQLKRFANMSCYVPTISKIVTVTLIILTVLGYMVIFSPTLINSFQGESEEEIPVKASGHFETY